MFGRWEVVSSKVNLGKYGPEVVVRCEHTEKYVLLANLKSGKSTACSKCTTYGVKNFKKLKSRWEQIIERCYNKECESFHRYGGRGIKVSEEFKDYIAFCKYVDSLEKKSEKHNHVDRIDNNKGYERGNLRWVTPSENNRNKENLRWVTYKGERMCLQDFLEKHTELARNAVSRMLKEGVPTEKIAELKRGQSIRYCERKGDYKIRSTRWANIS